MQFLREVGSNDEKLFVRHALVLVPMLATFLGLVAIGLMFLLEHYQHKKEDKAGTKEEEEEDSELIPKQNGCKQSSRN